MRKHALIISFFNSYNNSISRSAYMVFSPQNTVVIFLFLLKAYLGVKTYKYFRLTIIVILVLHGFVIA